MDRKLQCFKIISRAYRTATVIAGLVVMTMCTIMIVGMYRKMNSRNFGVCPNKVYIQQKLLMNGTMKAYCEERAQCLSPKKLPVTALASPYGSGNTWTRHLLQQATGIGTSAVYCDPGLLQNGYPFECHHGDYDRVTVVKTHEYGKWSKTRYDRAVLIIRNPFDFIVSSYHTRHNQVYDEEEYFKPEWRKHVQERIKWWVSFNNYWLTEFDGPVYPLLYHKLVKNLRTELWRLLIFLNIKISENEMECVEMNKEGVFHRPKEQRKRTKSKMDYFNMEEKTQINVEFEKIKKTLKMMYSIDWGT